MVAHHDILNGHESLRKPVLGSLAFHVVVLATAVIYTVLPASQVVHWGDADSLGGGAVAITPVSKIPIPPRSGRVNPLANDTQSQVPAPPPTKTRSRATARQAEQAIAIPTRKKTRKSRRRRPRRRTPGSRATVAKPNQLYNPGGAAANSAMFGSTTGGSGGVGIGQGNPLGNRFGSYVAILRQRVAAAWDTSQVDPQLQSAPTVIVRFDLQRDGSIRNLRFLQRSGYPTLDYSAQRAILDASPFPPLPLGFERDSARIEIWFELKR